MLLENTGVEIAKKDGIKVYFAPMGEQAEEKAFELCTKLREKGIASDFDHMGRGIKAQFKYADKIGAEYVAVIGSDEIANGSLKLKRMADGQERMVKFDDLINEQL